MVQAGLQKVLRARSNIGESRGVQGSVKRSPLQSKTIRRRCNSWFRVPTLRFAVIEIVTEASSGAIVRPA